MMDTSLVSEVVRSRFVGRQDALHMFYQRFAYIHMQNGVYYWGEGGTGKSWILQKIYLDNLNDPTRLATKIINFFDTSNQSIRDLQIAIRERLEQPSALDIFKPYDNVIGQIEMTRSNPNEYQSGLLASLEGLASKVFIECCEKAVRNRKVILLFDTFERVQQRDVGHWMLRDFLPQVTGLIVAIAGRPFPPLNPVPAPVPDNIVSFELGGLELMDVNEYVQKTWPKLPILSETIENIYLVAGGKPLLLDLIFDLTSADFIHKLDEISKIRETDQLKRELVKHFHEPTELNRVIWAMAFLKRRFDLKMLKFIVDQDELLELASTSFDTLIAQLHLFKFVKEYPDHESHLLHDEMQVIIAKFLLEHVDPRWDLRGKLHESIVQKYYPQRIDEARNDGNENLAKQLEAEQFGYVFEKFLKDKNLKEGLEHYRGLRNQIETSHNYDFEELIWGEVRDHLLVDEIGYETSYERGQWLRNLSLFSKAEDHFSQMIKRYQNQRTAISKSLGFSQLRQGKIEEAISTFTSELDLVPKDNFKDIADLENLLGQAKRNYGHWSEALDHYARSLRAFQWVNDELGMAGVNINRSYIYAAQGLYDNSKVEAQRALAGLANQKSNEAERKLIFAQLNMGTSHRHAGEFESAEKWYLDGLDTAKRIGQLEGQCHALENLGINLCLFGRKLRREGINLDVAAQKQFQALDYMTEALSIAGGADWRLAVADGLSRLARVYEEIYRLVNSAKKLKKTSGLKTAIQDLENRARTFKPAVEVEYEYDLLLRGDFSRFNWLEKSARLFELSYLIADKAEDFHRALDSLMEFTRLLIELKQYEIVPIVLNRTERLRRYDYQDALFSAMAGISHADLDFGLENYQVALEKYTISYAELAKQTGYASYLLTDRLKGLEERLHSLPAKKRIEWCDILEDGWLAQTISTVRPDMLRLLEDVRFNAMAEIGNKR